MNKAVSFLLLVAVIVLAFLLYRCEQSKNMKGGGQTRAHHRKDHKNNPVDTEDCPTLVGKKGDVCIIPISYLQDMTQPGGSDTAIEVHHKETIIWIGDNGESIDVQPMAGIDCSNHNQSDVPPNGDPSVIDMQTGAGGVKYAHVTDKPGNDGYCYKTNIIVTTLDKKTTTIDPHLFDEGP